MERTSTQLWVQPWPATRVPPSRRCRCSEVSAHSWMFPGLEAFRASSEVGSVCSAGIWRPGPVLLVSVSGSGRC